MKINLKQRDKLDPRTKVFLLFLCIIAAIFAPSLKYELILVCIICIFGIYQHVIRYAILSLLAYIVIYIFTILLMKWEGGFQVSLISFLGLIHQVYPCGMMSGIIISSTHVGEFLTAMNQLHMSQKIIIPVAVMLRYLPTIKEDLGHIKDAMHLRDVSPSLLGFMKNPLMTIECIYVPLMMRASQTADELTIASITRGIENPVSRTSLIHIGFHIQDVIIAIVFIIINFVFIGKGVF